MAELIRAVWEPEDVVANVDDNVWLIDLGFQGRRGVIAAYLLSGDDQLALIETGPTTTLPILLQGIEKAGFTPSDLTHVFLTHIHLDHSGGAGVLLRDAPKAQVYVHPIGAPHLVDPSRLISSATRIYEDRMDVLWGEISPIPAERVTALDDNEMLPIAGRRFRVLHTPGHASHHIAYVDLDAEAVYTGDVGGIRMQGTDYVCPSTPPPDLDRDSWRSSVDRLRSISPRRLYLTHFGVIDDAPEHLDRLIPELDRFIELGAAILSAGADPSTLTDKLHERMEQELGDVPGDVLVNLEWATPSYMATLGLKRYLAASR